jgi:hypothetical protein
MTSRMFETAGDEHEHALESQTETGMRHGSVAAQIEDTICNLPGSFVVA